MSRLFDHDAADRLLDLPVGLAGTITEGEASDEPELGPVGELIGLHAGGNRRGWMLRLLHCDHADPWIDFDQGCARRRD
ncbi:hypothetical protein [Sphingomicrobium sediminis]|uniref:Uncharacterized protein n=1 Tax=Sphingomicrobium sediminis TaxID=2950949 RepID=A0A9X2EG40_9SPHN|nr:hypothetical protein [Sphingomicrobium sediminis]MCM8557358.1 hypothetical protein [Sphingomicrobium sediminis]